MDASLSVKKGMDMQKSKNTLLKVLGQHRVSPAYGPGESPLPMPIGKDTMPVDARLSVTVKTRCPACQSAGTESGCGQASLLLQCSEVYSMNKEKRSHNKIK